MNQYYSDPSRASDPHALPDVEVFYCDANEHAESGWYYWFCLPGCLPDGDPIGPFETEHDAIIDAQGGES